MSDFYTDAEIAEFRRQLREGNARAREVADRRGYKLHPRIAARALDPKNKNEVDFPSKSP